MFHVESKWIYPSLDFIQPAALLKDLFLRYSLCLVMFRLRPQAVRPRLLGFRSRAKPSRKAPAFTYWYKARVSGSCCLQADNGSNGGVTAAINSVTIILPHTSVLNISYYSLMPSIPNMYIARDSKHLWLERSTMTAVPKFFHPGSKWYFPSGCSQLAHSRLIT